MNIRFPTSLCLILANNRQIKGRLRGIIGVAFGAILFLTLAEVTSATIQIPDTLFFGGRKYGISEIPMLGLWDYREGEPEPGKQKPPSFEVTNTANWSGYNAQFEIRDSKLWLKKITGRIDGKKRQNEEIIVREKFPIVAKWFTGRIHLAVGDFDGEKQEATSVIIFHIENGIVSKTEYAERMKPIWTWNGLPPSDEHGSEK